MSLPTNLNLVNLTVSGISSGAYFANQFQISFSKSVKGGAFIAGGPYYCAMNNFYSALNSCMETDGIAASVSTLVQWTKNAAKLGYIDPYQNLENSKIFIQNGLSDNVIDPKLGQDNYQFYKQFGTKNENIKTVFELDSAHGWPVYNQTETAGSPCDEINDRFMNNCEFEVAWQMVKFLYGFEQTPKFDKSRTWSMESLTPFDQKKFCPLSNCKSISMANTGYIYIPEQCLNGSNPNCKLMVSFHGCQMGAQDSKFKEVGENWMLYNGLLQIADATDLVILYPQAISSTFNPTNPYGCWDWWGYTNSLYAVKSGPQIRTVQQMVNQIYRSNL